MTAVIPSIESGCHSCGQAHPEVPRAVGASLGTGVRLWLCRGCAASAETWEAYLVAVREAQLRATGPAERP